MSFMNHLQLDSLPNLPHDLQEVLDVNDLRAVVHRAGPEGLLSAEQRPGDEHPAVPFELDQYPLVEERKVFVVLPEVPVRGPVPEADDRQRDRRETLELLC